MKRKVSVRLSEQVVERLAVAARGLGVSRSSVVEAALDRYLDSDGDQSDDATLGRLDRMSRQLTQLDCDLRVASETVALHARYHLTVTPPLRATDQRAACALGRERFEEFAAQVARRVHLGTPLMRETMDRLIATSPDLFAHDLEQGVPPGAQVADHEPGIPASIATSEESELSAAGREDGSNGGFSEEGSCRSR
jgi:Arc/MetJ-type ribon-helix-helix transcriptional regulator